MFKISKIPAKSAFGEPSLQFSVNGVDVDMFYGWDNCEGNKWAFCLTLKHPLINFSIDEKGGQAADISRLIGYMNAALESAGKETVGFLARAELVPAITEALKPTYLKAPTHSASDDYYGE